MGACDLFPNIGIVASETRSAFRVAPAHSFLDNHIVMNIFKRIQKQQPPSTQHKPPHLSLAEPVHVANLAPKFTIPAIPHPCPHHSLALLVTRQGLLVRPIIDDVEEPTSCVRIKWGKDVEVEEVGNELKLDWKGAAVVYGILGFVKLFTGMKNRIIFVPYLSLAIKNVYFRFIHACHHRKVRYRRLCVDLCVEITRHTSLNIS